MREGSEDAGAGIPVGSKLIRDDPGRNVRAWCSWCYRATFHGRIKRNRVFRDVYVCQPCSHRTVPCRLCKQMARGHTDNNDSLCSHCHGLIPAWGQVPPDARMLGFCSWCFHLSYHAMRDHSLVFRNSYACERCDGPTTLCIACKDAFARCSSFYNEFLCAECDQSINTWSAIEENMLTYAQRGEPVRDAMSPMVPFAPVREKQHVKLIVDGKDFFSAAVDAIEHASETIFLSFWHFNSFIYMNRDGVGMDDSHRIDAILKRKAEQGVRIFVLLWRETLPQFSADNFSIQMKKQLHSLHPNIICIRHSHPTPWSVFVSHHQKFIVVDQDTAIVGGLDICLGRYDTEKHLLVDPGASTWPGCDYYNPHIDRPSDPDHPEIDVVDRQHVPRMPWHDVDVQLYGAAARDVSRNFIQRWNHHKDIAYPHKSIPSLVPKDDQETVNPAFAVTGTCRVQVIRSLDVWSGGSSLETSIYGSYLEAVRGAEHYIYIENQYLSSSLAGGGVQNQVFQYILEKLRVKIRENQVFRLILVLTQPEETGDDFYELLRWQYQTLNRGGSSLVEQLHSEFPNVNLERYIAVFFPRQHGRLHGKPVTEKVFVHSKTMLVDDRVAIVSSANFNDRSFLGHLDSELGAVIEDDDKVASSMNRVPFQASRFCHDMRVQLWSELLGIDASNGILTDPIVDAVYVDMLLHHAKRNTALYESVFPSIPSNAHRTLDSFVAAGGLQHPAPPVNDGYALTFVQGLITMHPLGFLMDQDIATIRSKVVDQKWWQ